MDEQTASLIIRMAMALSDEGIGPLCAMSDGERVDTSTADTAVLTDAVRVAGKHFTTFQLWDAGLIPGEQHMPPL
jgi:hypothetical protein